ncbi:MAG TPA: HEAT repeat domain-containing protein, partial [Candidatus Limnocylindria bacterium]|nr:HEAT repeat domain-containing protein [Candidatus Limnocylindria bacterium]
EIATFLDDPNPRIVTEAARAINDEPISGVMDVLAARLGGPDIWPGKLQTQRRPFLRRAINANYRFGTKETAARLAKFATDDAFAEELRVEALDSLAEWPKNGGRDHVTGLWRPTAFVRDSKIPGAALEPVLPLLLAGTSDDVRTAAAYAAGELKSVSASATLARLVIEKQGNAKARAAALTALSKLQTPEYGPALAAAQNDPEELVRKAAVKLGVEAPPIATAAASGTAPTMANDPVAKLAAVIASGTLSEKQNAFAAIAKLPGTSGDAFLTQWLNDLLAGKVAPELQLDVLDAAGARPALKPLVAKYEAALPKATENDINPWKVCLTGGNAEEGKKVFFEKAEVSCNRCHKVNGEGGEVGPELTGVVGRKGRDYVLRSVLYPNAEIAQGFESVLVTVKNGTAYAGVIKSETPEILEINSPEDGLLKLKKSDIESREKGLSGMPEGFGTVLTKQELRNLVEFLASTK